PSIRTPAHGLGDHRPIERGRDRRGPASVGLPLHRVDRGAAHPVPEAGPWDRGLSQEYQRGAGAAGHPVEASPTSVVAPPRDLAAVKRGLKRGLRDRIRTVMLMLDETIITEIPPLYSCYGHIGEQVRVPITGNRSKRILHGAINVKTGDISLLIT